MAQLNGFRPELQALRALAVAMVVTFHVWPNRLPGGFVGVDVFFVISGYLITSHLLREVTSTGSLNVAQFWARRIRRLLPAAFTVLAVSLAIVLLLLPIALWEQNLIEIAASAGYVVNWVLAFSATDYFGAENAPSLVQHFWSLAVEEQFYVVWPLAILLALAIARWRLRRGRPNSGEGRVHTIVIVLLVITAASLVFSAVETQRDSSFAYFITPTRAWEFGLGALLATPAATRWLGALTSRPRVASLVGWAGIAAIAWSGFFYSSATPFPGLAAIVPVVGTLAAIGAGNPATQWTAMTVGRLRPVQFVGDISYSVYLWHWPLVVVAAHVFDQQPRWAVGSAIVAASLGLGWATKKYIEDPVRFGAFWAKRRTRAFGLALAGSLTIGVLALTPVGVLTWQGEANRQEALQPILDGDPCYGAAAMVADAEADCGDVFAIPPGLDLAFAANDRSVLADLDCQTDDEEGSIVKRCVVGSLEPESIGIAIVGNSHAGALTSGLIPLAETAGWSIHTYFRQECLGDVRKSIAEYQSVECIEWTNEVLDEIIADDSIDVVVYQSYVWALPTDVSAADRDDYARAVGSVWDELRAAGKSVVVVSDVPGTRPDAAPTCIDEDNAPRDPCVLPRPDFMTGNALYRVATDDPSVTTIDLTKYFCTEDLCHALIGGVVVYFDAHHLTNTYSRTLAPYVGAELRRVIESR